MVDMNWMDNYLNDDDSRKTRLDRCADRIKEARPTIWTALFDELRLALERLRDRKPGLIDPGGLVRHSNAWSLRRLERPPYTVLVELQGSAILVEHDFRVSPIQSHGDTESTVVDIRCDQHEEVYLAIDGGPVTVEEMARRILEPIVSGQRPL